jgi:SAM-dependent methyltransferase
VSSAIHQPTTGPDPGLSPPRPGSAWAVLPGRRPPRWWMPRRPTQTARIALGIYQPVTAKARLGWRVARVAARLGALRLAPCGPMPPAAVLARLAPHVPAGGDVAVMRSSHPERYVALVMDAAGRPCTVAKVALSAQGEQALRHEADAIRKYGRHVPSPLATPRIVAAEPGLLATVAVDWRLRRHPWRCTSDLSWALGRLTRSASKHGGGSWAHGDVAPWNLVYGSQGWVLLDWEDARSDAPPFYDLFHFIVQSHALLERPRTRAILEGLRGCGWIGEAIAAYSGGAGLDRRAAREHLTVYLRASLASLDPAKRDGRAGIKARQRLLERLAESSPARRSPARGRAAVEYRDALRTSEQAHHYDRVLYRPGSYDAWLWRLERRYLSVVFDRHFGAKHPRYLDFACGSGRILAALEGRCHEPTGIDVSSAMLDLARGKVEASRLVHGDLASDASLLTGSYELITAFRFFLNAEGELRAQALRALHRLLAEDGVLILNIHGNTPSIRSLSVLVRRFRHPRETPPRQLSFPAMRRLLADHGFEVVDSRGYGFLTSGCHRLLTPAASLALEPLGRLWPVKYLAVQLLVTCRKRVG